MMPKSSRATVILHSEQAHSLRPVTGKTSHTQFQVMRAHLSIQVQYPDIESIALRPHFLIEASYPGHQAPESSITTY